MRIFLFLIVIATLAACGKDESNPTVEAITGTSCWEQVRIEVFSSTTQTWIEFPLLDCAKDDCTRFTKDYKLTIDEGAVKCDSTSAQTTSGNWTIDANGDVIFTRSDLGGAFIYTVSELSKDRMVIENDFFGQKNRATYEPR